MKQPELGRKLAEMRKAKGLTQEDLVAKCNLSVRTIQRIEAGEVTPRSYTVKALFEALGAEWEDEGRTKTEVVNKTLPPSLRRLIPVSIGAGIVYFLVSILEFTMEMTMADGSDKISFAFYFPVKVISLMCHSLFLFAFFRIATFSENWTLQTGVWLMIFVNFIGSCIQIFLVYLSGIPMSLTIGIPLMVSFGAVYLFFGFGLLKFDSPWKSVAGPLGVLCMVTGFLLITVLGAILGMATTVVLYIGLIYFLAWYSKNFERIPFPDSTFSPELQS
jgi:transcriptional regulator with XRE-family HTH domain